MPNREHAELLLRKAAQDEFTLDKLVPDPASPDEVIGFHAQQAVEKLLKAVLADRSIAYPPELEDIRRLTPFATAFRYDELPDEPEDPFDPRWARECVAKTRTWVESVIGPC